MDYYNLVNDWMVLTKNVLSFIERRLLEENRISFYGFLWIYSSLLVLLGFFTTSFGVKIYIRREKKSLVMN